MSAHDVFFVQSPWMADCGQAGYSLALGGIMKRTLKKLALQALTITFITAGCTVGPKYSRPDVPVTPAFKEPLPEGWKQAEPNDGEIKGKWWEIYNDAQLNALEEQIAVSNENVLLA